MPQDSSPSAQVRLVFFGECLPGHHEADVRLRVAQLMGLDEQQIATVFSGQRIVLKPALPSAEGLRYAQHFAALGARTLLEDIVLEPVVMPPPAAPPAPTISPAALTPSPPATFGPVTLSPMPPPASPASGSASAATPKAAPRMVPPRPPMSLLAQMFGFDFDARMGRLAFLFASVVTVPIALVFAVISWRNHSVLFAFLTLAVPCFIQVRAAVMRCHDVGRSPWWLLTWLVPILGSLFWIYLLLAPGYPGSNRRGVPGQSPTFGQVAVAGGICALVFFAVMVNQMQFDDEPPPVPVARPAPPPPAPAPALPDPSNVVVVYSMKGCEVCGIRILELRALGLSPKEVRVDESDAASAEMLAKMAQANQPVSGLKMPVVDVNGVILSSAPTLDEIRKALRWVTSGTG